MNIVLHDGDCLLVLPTLAENSLDACVTDPPYHLTSIVKRFGGNGAVPAQYGSDGRFQRASTGFMGRTWDGGDVAFRPAVWREVWRVLKPGAHLLAFGGTRTYHRMACAIEDAGFEIRDCIQWLYGSGFPKSHDVSKGVDRAAGAEREVVGKRQFANGTFARDGAVMGQHGVYGAAAGNPLMTAPATSAARQWQGWGTALKPACELIVLARKPLSERTIAANVLRWGTGALNIDGCRVETDELANKVYNNSGDNLSWGGTYGKGIVNGNAIGRWPANLIHDGSEEVAEGFPETQSNGGGTSSTGFWQHADKLRSIADGDEGSAARFFATFPQNNQTCNQTVNGAENCSLGCHRPNGVIAPSSVLMQDELKIAQNVKYAGNLCGLCAIAIAQSLVAMRRGQSPEANLSQVFINEHSKRILSQSLALYVAGRENTDIITTIPSLQILFGSVHHAIGEPINLDESATNGRSGRRTFYSSKADSDDRLGSKHPTVKPLDLMQYLVRLVTPKGGTVLDPFAGTGSTGEAAFREGMRAVLIEREPEYQADIRRRIELLLAGPDERAYVGAKERMKDKPRDDGPLFDRVL